MKYFYSNNMIKRKQHANKFNRGVFTMPKTAKKKRKGKGSGPMPSGGAGLIRFFEDETPGIKVGPTVVLVLAGILVVATVIAHLIQQIQIAAAS